jgi:hypothetical protein
MCEAALSSFHKFSAALLHLLLCHVCYPAPSMYAQLWAEAHL